MCSRAVACQLDQVASRFGVQETSSDHANGRIRSAPFGKRPPPDSQGVGVYWDYLGWKDPYSLNAATLRQREYARHLGEDGVYTPQMVVDGTKGFVGSDRAEGLSAIAAAARKSIPVTLARDGGSLLVTIGAGAGTAQVLLVGYDPSHETPIGRGENSGRTLRESNIVRSVTPIGAWTGSTITLHQSPPAGEGFAVLLQAVDGRIIGAARLPS
jgi:hypothetical protein